jgi:oxygen-dependent protoporphyrinogen oxidase
MVLKAFRNGGAMRPDLVDLSNDELNRLAQEELASLLGITGLPLFTDVARWREAMPQYHVGHVARVERIEHRADLWPNFALASTAYHGVGIPQCITSGESAAQRAPRRVALNVVGTVPVP